MPGFSLEVLQFGLLTWQFLKAYSLGHSKETLNVFPFKGHGAIELASLTGPAESKNSTAVRSLVLCDIKSKVQGSTLKGPAC